MWIVVAVTLAKALVDEELVVKLLLIPQYVAVMMVLPEIHSHTATLGQVN